MIVWVLLVIASLIAFPPVGALLLVLTFGYLLVLWIIDKCNGY